MSSYHSGSYQQPPGMTPPPPPGVTPPPGTTPPSQFGPGPIGPGGQQGSNAWKYIFIGCAAVALIAIVALVGTCAYMGTKGGDLFVSILEMGKSEYMNMLTPDHTQEQRQAFSEHYDLIGQKISEDGVITFFTKYERVFTELDNMGRDKRITVEESQEWVQTFDELMQGDY